MKKIFCFLIIALLSFSIVGCSIDKVDNKKENETSPNAEAEKDNTNESQDNTKDSNQLQFLNALEEYVSSDAVSETLLKAYNDADTVTSVPILGTYLESTNIVAYMFYSKGEVCSTALLSFDMKGSPIDIELTEFAETHIDENTVIDVHSKDACYSAVKNCLSATPDFEILGIVFNDTGYPFTLPIGRCKGELVIKYYLNEPKSFNLVEPFETIEEGRIAFAKYLAEKDAIKAQIPVFLWKNESFYETGFWRMYSLDYVYEDKEEYRNMILPELETIDSWISIPLLSDEFKEGVLISHLLYYRNQLIGEVVIMKKTDNSVMAVHVNMAKKTPDGIYLAIEKSQYQNAVEMWRDIYPEIDIEGVIFKNGKYIPYGYSGDDLVMMQQ